MITLNLNEGKRLKFTYGVSHVHPENIHGKFVLDFNDSYVSFPIKIDEGKIIVEIKCTDRFLKEDIGVVRGKLEVVAMDTFIVPWEGEVEIKGNKLEVKNEVEEVTEIKDKLDEKIELLKKKKNDFSKFIDTPVEEMIEKKDLPKKESVFSDLINTPVEEIIEKKEKEEDKVFSEFLDAPIEEIIS